MKRIYLLLFLLAAFITNNASAQRQCNLDIIVRLDSSYATNSTYAIIGNGYKFLAEPTGYSRHKFIYIIKNLGPDTIAATDTLWVVPEVGTTYYGNYAVNSGKGMKVGDSAYVVPGSLFTLTPSAQITKSQVNSSYQWCDSVFVTGTNANKVVDPVATNNLECHTVEVTFFATSVNDVASIEQSFNVYPNPATNNISFDFDFGASANASVIVRDIQGKVVYAKELGKGLQGKQSFSIDAGSFSNGLYFVELNANGTKKVAKVSVQK
jgi:hypothetical protein